MPVQVVKMSYLDPVWAFRAPHVHWVLSRVLEFWSDELGASPMQLKGPFPAKHHDRLRLLSQERAGRLESLQPAKEIPAVKYVSPFETGKLTGESLLYASVLWGAARDWADNCYSPFATQQRKALQAYWWLMGLPYVAPPGMTREDWEQVALGRKRKHKVPADVKNPLPAVGLSLSALFTMRREDPPLPPAFGDATPVTLHACCDVLDLDPCAIRTYVHFLPPD